MKHLFNFLNEYDKESYHYDFLNLMIPLFYKVYYFLLILDKTSLFTIIFT